MSGPAWPADFLRIVWMECTGVPGALGDLMKWPASLGGCNVEVDEAIVWDVG